jgi:hypothetical protein
VAALGWHTYSRGYDLGFGEYDFKPRAATEGRPYSLVVELRLGRDEVQAPCGGEVEGVADGCGTRVERVVHLNLPE